MADVGVFEPLPANVTDKFFRPFSQTIGRYGVHGDGSCFFHSIACAIDADQYHQQSHADRQRIGLRLRKQIESHLEKGGEAKWKAFWKRRKLSKKALQRVPSYDTILSQVQNTSTWAATHLIMYAMQKLRLNHVFIDATTNRIYCGVVSMSKKHRPLVMILWVDHSHFEPITTTTQFCFPMSHPIAKHVAEIFEASPCPLIKEDDVLRGAGKVYEVFKYAFDATIREADRAIIRDILADPRGWKFEYVEAKKDPDVVIKMWPNQKLVRRFSKQFDRLSVCIMNSVPRVIVINKGNWNKVPKPFHGTLEEYRQYLIMHEMGHAHGKLHESAIPGKPCPVMFQQTKGAGGLPNNCLVRPFPFMDDS